MTINNNSVEQINVALLDMDKKLKSAISKSASASDFNNLEASVDNIKRTLNETKTGLEPGKTYNINISGNAATADKAKEAEKANKLVNALTVNGITYDGSEAVDAGVQTVENGGTGVTTQADINKAFIGNLDVGNSDVTDGTEFVSSYASDNGFAETAEGALNSPYKRQFIKVWNYIRDKISSVLGLTSANYGGTANKATNDGNGNNIVNTYALKSDLQYTKSININKVDGSSDTQYYLIAETLASLNASNIESLCVIGSDFRNRMFEGAITTREGNIVYNYGKDNLPIELYEQTNGDIYVYWLVSDTYNKVALNVTATDSIVIYGGNLSPVTPTGSKMTLTEYDYKSYKTLPIARGGTGETTANAAANAFINSLELGNSDPKDEDYYVCQSAGGNSETPVNTVYTRRPISKLWNYIKDKISSVLGLTKDTYGGNAATADAIIDYIRGTPIKVRWGGDGINSAEWYPAFNADGSAIEPIHENNIHAGTAGTANIAKNMYSQTFDLSALDKTKFYPLVGFNWLGFAEVAICSDSGMASAEYNQNRIHFDISTMGWSDTPYTLNIREYTCYENNEITIGCIGRGVHNGAWAIWLRGGIHYTCYSRDADLSLKTSDYTYGDETYTVGTNYYGGSNTNVSVGFTPQSTITEGAYSSRPITAPNIKASSKMVIPIGEPSSLENGCIWIEG